MPRTTRRSFAKTIAAATAGLPVMSSGGAPPPVRTGEAPVLHPLAEALVGVVRAQSGQYLDAADMKRIEAAYREYVPQLERLRSVKLSNSDEPDYTFASLTKRWS